MLIIDGRARFFVIAVGVPACRGLSIHIRNACGCQCSTFQHDVLQANIELHACFNTGHADNRNFNFSTFVSLYTKPNPTFPSATTYAFLGPQILSAAPDLSLTTRWVINSDLLFRFECWQLLPATQHSSHYSISNMHIAIHRHMT